MPPRDLMSQLNNPEVARRFRVSAGERELVKEQIKLGKSPVEIEKADRVKRRIRDLGINENVAADLTRDVKAAAESREARATPHPENPGLERIIGENNLLSSVFLERGAEATKPICCIHENGYRIGTGFLVTPRVLMTNAHVISSEAAARNCHAEFNFEDRLIGVGIEPTFAFKLAPDELFFSSPENVLDYTLVAVEPKSVSDGKLLKDFAFLPLDPSVANALRGECLNILQHPNGAPKRLALRENRFTALLERYVHYESDTLPGSSGSPVFNDQWQVVCLHHAGVPLRDENGNILTTDNRVWDPDVDSPTLIKWIGNEGIRISRIVADVIRQIRVKHGDAWPKLLAEFPRTIDNPPNEEERLDSETQSPPDQTRSRGAIYQRNSTHVPDDRPDPEPPATPPQRDSQSVTISVTVGNAPPVVVQVSPTGGKVTIHPPADGGPSPGSTDGTAPDEPGGASRISSLVARGLQNLERSQKRKYYDEDQDEDDRDEYYRDVDPEGDSFLDGLQSLVTETHTTRLSYKVARIEHLYAWVDLQRDKKVRSIYSDERFDPKKFINEDFTIERNLERLVERRLEREGTSSPEAMERFLAALEAQEPFNCEHVVPQSWFGNDAPMQGDLHHLFTCQNQCNSFRGNRPYKDFGKFAIALEAATRPKCGHSDDGLFEPFMGKGKVARATLYFLVRYPGQFENMYDDVDGGIETLLDWHERSRVTEHERHRNQAIFGIQGNRNPFIDHPEWAASAFAR